MLFQRQTWTRKTYRWFAIALLTIVTLGLTTAPLHAQANLNSQLQQAVDARDWTRALQIVDRMILEYPESADRLRAYRTRLESLAGGNTAPPPLVSPSRTTPAAAPVSQITEARVRQVMNSLKTASVTGNVQGMVQLMAPDAVIQVAVQSPLGNQNIRISRAEYQRQLAENFSLMQNPKYLDYNLQVQVAPDGQSAIARESATMSVTVAGQPMVIRSAGQTTLELRQGQVLITAVQGQAQMQLR